MLFRVADLLFRLSLIMAAFSRNPELRFQRVKYMTVNEFRTLHRLPKLNIPVEEWKPEANK